MPFRSKEVHQEYYRRYYKVKIAKLRTERGNKCEFCGWNEVPEVLEFAHKQGTIKYLSISKLMRYKWTLVLEELIKCFLLCPTCHRVYDLKGRYPNGEEAVLKTVSS